MPSPDEGFNARQSSSHDHVIAGGVEMSLPITRDQMLRLRNKPVSRSKQQDLDPLLHAADARFPGDQIRLLLVTRQREDR